MIECLRVLRFKFDDVAIKQCRCCSATNELSELNFEVLSELTDWLTVSAAH